MRRPRGAEGGSGGGVEGLQWRREGLRGAGSCTDSEQEGRARAGQGGGAEHTGVNG